MERAQALTDSGWNIRNIFIVWRERVLFRTTAGGAGNIPARSAAVRARRVRWMMATWVAREQEDGFDAWKFWRCQDTGEEEQQGRGFGGNHGGSKLW